MELISTTMTIISGLGQAIDLTKKLRDADLNLNEAETKFRIAELYNALSDVKMSVADLKMEIEKKDELIRNLEAKLRLEAELLWKDPFYFRRNPNGVEDGPFCHNCYDTKRLLVRIPKDYDNDYLRCSSCTKTYDKTSGRGRNRQLIRQSSDRDYDEI